MSGAHFSSLTHTSPVPPPARQHPLSLLLFLWCWGRITSITAAMVHHHYISALRLPTTPHSHNAFPQRRRPPVTSEGIIGLIGVILLGIFKQLGAKVRTGLNGIGEKCRLPPWFLGTLLTPAVGGTMVAYLAMAAPLILGDGNSQLGVIVKAAVLHNTSGATLDVNTVALTGLAKMAALGISLGFGFIGGQIFPLVFAGACAGAVATMVVPGLPLLVAMPCMMVGVPAAFVPSPFAFTMLVSLMLVLGPEATTPVFVSSFTSYVTSTVVTMRFFERFWCVCVRSTVTGFNPACYKYELLLTDTCYFSTPPSPRIRLGMHAFVG